MLTIETLEKVVKYVYCRRSVVFIVAFLPKVKDGFCKTEFTTLSLRKKFVESCIQLTLSWIMLKMAKFALKILHCKDRKIFKACLVIFQHHA